MTAELVLRVKPPYDVWIAVILVTREVSYKDVPATQPLSGYDALFAPVRTEARLSALVAAAGLSREECEAAFTEWQGAHPNIAGDHVITSVRLGRQPVDMVSALPVPVAKCADCGNSIASGLRCDTCTRKFWQKMREADTGEFAEV